jgi:uncharacterized protein (TIGR01777 family)
VRIVVAGGSGFLGHALTDALTREGHALTILSRGPSSTPLSRPVPQRTTWTPNGEVGTWAESLEGADAVVNLAGESIAEGRWTSAKKARVLESRVLATRSLARAMTHVSNKPRVFVSGSAVGYYGPRGDEIVTEEHRRGSDFLAQVCAAWEEEAAAADSMTTRVACIRTGLVLGAHGGALPRMQLPFRFGAGGRVGSGRQYWPWIHLDDWVALVRFIIETPVATGPINLTAPSPVTNAEFTKALGRAMRRPAFVPAPAFALRLALGEMADALLLSGQRAVPAVAERLGFRFAHRDIDEALQSLVGPAA